MKVSSCRPAALSLLLLLLFAGCSVSPTGTATSTSTTPATTPVVTIPNQQPFADTSGSIATYTSAGLIDESGPFFQPLGTNGRTCATCHQPNQGMSLSPAAVQALYTSTSGTDPLFSAIDGANYPTASSTDRTARSLLLNNGLIRIPVTLPKTTQFTITSLHDPYGCAITLSSSGQQVISVYRRPLPTSGLDYLSSIMWDTRETLAPLTSSSTLSSGLTTNLSQQMLDAVSTHMQGSATPTAAQLSAALAFEQGLYTAQITDTAAGSLSANGATGGPADFAAIVYYPGINDAFGGDPTSATFNPNVFTLYNAWQGSPNPQQASINRGQNIFNTAPLQIINVSGINDNTALGSPNNLRGSCSTCHDTPNLGNHSLPLPMDTGTAHLTASETDPGTLAGLALLSAPDLPTFQITGCKDTNNRPITYITSDPGKALLTGLCADIGRTKVPNLRGLAARAPYFHGGSAATLAQLVSFYNARFNMRLNPNQQQDLVNFLAAL